MHFRYEGWGQVPVEQGLYKAGAGSLYSGICTETEVIVKDLGHVIIKINMLET